MRLEHLIYSIAFAILIYAIYKKKYVFSIIISSAYIPDLDIVADDILRRIGITLLIYGEPINHGDFHNILILFIYGILVALILHVIRIRLIDSFILACIGFGAHLLEDAFVFNPGYRFFWPISYKKFGIGIMEYHTDLFGIADREVLLVGIILICWSLIIKYLLDRKK